jgi:MSHA pilin protein MshD
MLTMSSPALRQTGLTLIELIIFIVIVSVGIVGILMVLDVTVQRSSDPLVQKQAQALAEGLLDEIQTGYFAFCDGTDTNLKYGKTAADCASGSLDTYGVKADEDRPYDSVIHYATGDGVPTPLAFDLPGESISGPSGYISMVTIKSAALGDIPAVDTLLINVTVTGPNGVSAVAEGFRTRQVPL